MSCNFFSKPVAGELQPFWYFSMCLLRRKTYSSGCVDLILVGTESPETEAQMCMMWLWS